MEQLKKSGRLKIRIAARIRPRDVNDFAKINAALSPETGDVWLRTGPIKVTLDGGSTGALLTRPYAIKPDFSRRPSHFDGSLKRDFRAGEPK